MGLGFRVWDLGFGGFRILGFWGLGFRVFGVWGLGFMMWVFVDLNFGVQFVQFWGKLWFGVFGFRV